MKTVEIETTPSLEQQVAKRANDKELSASWNINILILANALLIAVILMGLEGVAIEILAPVAAVGIGTVWFISRIRRKRLYHQFYGQEIAELDVVTRDEKDEVPRVEKKESPIESPLSSRESQILSRIASGYLNKQVATEFGISEHTIKNHMTHILEKLDVGDRTHAVVIAMQNGWISPVSTINTTNGKPDRNSVKQYLKDDSSSVTIVH